MKAIKQILALAALATLAACGGGGGSSSDNTQPAPVQFDVTPILGTWAPVDLKCYPKLEYNPIYFYKQKTITLAADSMQVVRVVYTDKACNVKAGNLTETLSVVYAPGSAAGKSTVAKINLTYTGAIASADDGSAITIPKASVGSQAIGSTSKGLLAVDGNSLYVGESSGKDAEGYPTTLYPEVGATR
jgi:hypothetical protein